jgi:hypothetical protein
VKSGSNLGELWIGGELKGKKLKKQPVFHNKTLASLIGIVSAWFDPVYPQPLALRTFGSNDLKTNLCGLNSNRIKRYQTGF